MEVDKVRLIEEIRRRPLLWDFRHVYESRNNKKIVELWQEIARILETEVASCKLVWQKLRTAFFNEMKRIPMRIDKAKRKGTYDPSKKYNTCPFFDSLKFIAYGRSARGLYNQSLQVNLNIKLINNESSVQKQCPKVKKIKNAYFTSENDKTCEILPKSDSQPMGENFKSSTTDLGVQEKACKNESELGTFSYNDIILIQKNTPSSMPKPELSVGSANMQPIVEETKGEKNNQSRQPESNCKTISNNNCSVIQEEQTNIPILIYKKEPGCEFELDDTFTHDEDISCEQENKFFTATNSEPLLANSNFEPINSNESNKSGLNQLMHLEDTCSKSVHSADLDYEFLHKLVPRMKQMSHLQKLKFRAKMSSLMLDIFSSSVTVKYLDKRVLLCGDNDPDKKFLISFLPFLKSMPWSQNLQFRDKICDLVLNILCANKFCYSSMLAEC